MTHHSNDSLLPLRDDVRMLGTELGNVIRSREGEDVFDLVERIRDLSKRVRDGEHSAATELTDLLGGLDVETSRTIARCFAHFLNLSNVAEQHHRLRRRRQREESGEIMRGSLFDTVERLKERGLSAETILEVLGDLSIEVVMTAHPTEVSRRTLLALNRRLGNLLAELDIEEITPRRKGRLLDDVRRTIVTIWETEDIRREKPSAIYEAQGGLMIFEQTIWDAVPKLLRQLDEDLHETTGERLDPFYSPFHFGSWAGGDRDGNPNVTAGVTRRTTMRARWLAATLLDREIGHLREELPISDASEELRALTGESREPYRDLLQKVSDALRVTITEIERALEKDDEPDVGLFVGQSDVARPLALCWRSLVAQGLESLARGRLLDVIRQVETFGVTLARLDVRQEATRHDRAVAAAAGVPYEEWSVEERIEWLLDALGSEEPLEGEPPDEETAETLRTFRMIGALPQESFGAYVVSMASSPADVLAVELLQRRVGSSRLRVVPLFETLDDLDNAPKAMEMLFDLDWYREQSGGRQEIMLGYSDSARDGSRLAANWALYQAQEKLAELARSKGYELTLFHGRGGTVSRGGGPTQTALRSQPANTINGRLRVTEQGEMIQLRYGLEEIAVRTLEVYTTSVLEAAFASGDRVKAPWRELMTRLSEISAASYRELVYQTPRFVEYFRTATPEPELGSLNIGSRPARRKAGGGVESLRAIPWVFAWTQTRLLLPAWLGADTALQTEIDDGNLDRLREMYRDWPFFRSTIDLIEMVLAKASPSISVRYDEELVPDELRDLGETLRQRLDTAAQAIREITDHERLLESHPVLRRSIDVRNPYVDPINLIQVEILERMRREDAFDSDLFDAFVTTVNGIAAGMRNTG